MARILLWSSAVRVHDSQAYRKTNVTRERISRILDPREILLSIKAGFSLVNAAVCAILESNLGTTTAAASVLYPVLILYLVFWCLPGYDYSSCYCNYTQSYPCMWRFGVYLGKTTLVYGVLVFTG